MIQQNSDKIVLSSNAVSPLAPFGAILAADSPYIVANHPFADFLPIDTTAGPVAARLPPIGGPDAPLGRQITLVNLTGTNPVTIAPTPGSGDCIDYTGAPNATDALLLPVGALPSRVQLQACLIAGIKRWMPVNHSLV